MPSIIEYICNIEKHQTSFLLDEVDGELFTKSYAEKLKKVIEENIYLKEITIAPQSIKKQRTLHQNGIEIPCINNQFEKCGLNTIELKRRMRMTGKIYSLIQIAETCVEKVKVRFGLPELKDNQHSEKHLHNQENKEEKQISVGKREIQPSFNSDIMKVSTTSSTINDG